MGLIILIFFLILLTGEAYPQGLYSYYLLSQELKVISASQKEESLLKTPRYVRVITRKEIDKLGAKDLFELLDYLPEFYSRISYFGLSAVGALGLRQSYYSEKIQVLINGIPVSDPSTGSSLTVNNFFPLSNVKQVEIVYGPMTALYGYNTSLAIVNLITYSSNSRDKVESFVSTGHDSLTSLFVPIKNKKVSGSFSFDYVESRSPHRSYTDNAGLKGNFSSFRKSFDYYLELNFPSGFYVKSYSVERDDHFPETISGFVSDGNTYARRKTFINRLGYRFSAENLSGNLFAGYNYFYLKRAYNLCPFTNPYCSSLFSHELLSVEERYFRKPEFGGNFRLTTDLGELAFGVSYSEENLYKTRQTANFLPASIFPPIFPKPILYPNSRELSPEEKILPEKRRFLLSPYLQYDFHYNGYALLLNLKWSRVSDVGSDWNYNVSIMKRIDRSLFKINIGRALRVPSLEEMYIRNNPLLEGNPKLKFEKADMVMPSYDYIGDRIKFNVTAYYSRIKDLIYKKHSSQCFLQWENSDSSVRASGFVSSLNVKLTEEWEFSLSLGKGFSVKKPSGDDEYFNYPKEKLISGLSYEGEKLSSGLYLVAYSRASERAPGFYRIDYNSEFRISKNSKLILNVKNLLNRKYRFDEGTPGEERTLWLGFQLYY